MIEQIGTIVRVEGPDVWVESEIRSSCSGCQQQEHCGTGAVARAFASKRNVLKLNSQKTVEIGQQVVLGVKEKSLIMASVLMYLLPILVLVIVASILQYVLVEQMMVSELWVVAGAGGACYACYRWIAHYLHSDKCQSQYQPEILKVLTQTIEVSEINS